MQPSLPPQIAVVGDSSVLCYWSLALAAFPRAAPLVSFFLSLSLSLSLSLYVCVRAYVYVFVCVLECLRG